MKPHPAKSPRVLVVGIDGVRFDALTAAHTPALDSVAATGFVQQVRVHSSNPTISGPVWSTVATGVYADRHGVYGNSEHPKSLDLFPDFLERLRTARPEVATMSAASWRPLVEGVECGPLFSSGGFGPTADPDSADEPLAEWPKADDLMAGYAARRLATEDLAASFVYFGECDVFAHHRGTGAGYTASIERCDARLGLLVAAIESRSTRSSEDWTVIAVTDHGHLDEGGHGGETDVERAAWIAAGGNGIPSGHDVDHADISAQVLHTFGLSAADIEGVPFGRRPLAA